MILAARPVPPPAGPAASVEVSAPLKPSKVSAGVSSNEARSLSPPLAGGGTTSTVLKACEPELAAKLALLARSVNLPAATLTLIVPAALAAGVSSSRYFMSLTLISGLAVPPATTMSSIVKLVPTDSLNVKVNVTAPDAVTAAMLSSMTSVGATLSGDGSSPPPPQAATNSDAATAHAERANFFEG